MVPHVNPQSIFNEDPARQFEIKEHDIDLSFMDTPEFYELFKIEADKLINELGLRKEIKKPNNENF